MFRRCLITLLLLSASTRLLANVPPVVDSFVATPSVAAPGQSITLTLAAHDPDCATSCATGCGLTIRGDLLTWSDTTGRTPTPFQNSQPGPTASPFTATVTWIAPTVEGTYTVSAQVNDNGGMLCGGKKTTIATLAVTVANSQPPVIDSFIATPESVPVGGSIELAVTAHDPLNRPLSYAFASSAGTVSQTSPSSPGARWTAPQTAGIVTIRATVTPEGGAAVTAQVNVGVQIGSFVQALKIADTRATRAASLGDGRMLVVDGATGTLQMVSSTGAKLWSVAGLQRPSAVAVDNALFVVERGASRISVWDTDGRRMREFPLDAVLPNCIAAGPNPGELTISDTGGGRAIVIASSTGQVLRSIGDGVLSAPAGLAIANGRIAIADAGLGKVTIFDSAGTPLKTLGDSTLLVRPQGLAWDFANTRLVVSDSFSGELVVLGEEGTVRGSLAGFGSAPGQLINPIDVALMPGGLIAVTTAGGEIQEFRLYNSLAPVAAATSVVAADAAGDDGGAISVNWSLSSDDPARVTSYLVSRATGETGNFDVVGSVGKGIGTYTDRSTADGTCYHYQVVATDGVTLTASAATPCTTSVNDQPPPAPALLTSTADSPFAIHATWGPAIAADLAGYVIDVISAAGRRTVRVDAATTTTVLDALAPDTTYTLEIRAIDTANNVSAALTSSVATYPDLAPLPPASIVVKDAGVGATADVTWSEQESRVPTAKYILTFTPATAGWPVVTQTASLPHARVTGLVNTLTYSLSITAVTAWNRASDPSAPVAAVVTSPDRALAIVEPSGWDGENGMVDAAGTRVTFAVEAERRDLRFQYRSVNATLQLFLDGAAAGEILGDTAGAWVDATLVIEKRYLRNSATHTLEMRNASFPDPTAQLAVRRVDFVPLAPRNVRADGMNTVIDVVWTWQEARPDLEVRLQHTFDSGARATARFTPVSCSSGLLGRCRDTFIPNDQETKFELVIASPAGWTTDVSSVAGHPRFDEFPPPVTDLRVSRATLADGSPVLNLEWTPLSTALTKTGAPEPVSLYRVYRVEGTANTLLTETATAKAQLPAAAIDLTTSTLLVRSVDAQGRESR